MALNNILSRRDTILLPDGAPNRGGLIDLFEPNTAVRIATFKDSDLTEQNANPVVLDGAGKASIWLSPNADMDIRTAPTPAIPLGSTYVSEQSVNPDALGSGSASGLVPNGSFEIDTDANNEPDGWTLTNETGSTNFLDTLNSTDGLQSMRFESTGSGGGNIVTNDFFVVNDIDDLSVQFDLFSSVANVRNIVRVEWFDVSQVPISNSDVYDDSATNPVVFTSQQTIATPPAGARFAKLRIIGCDPSIATVGSTNFDRFNVFYPLTVSGAFDNLLLAGNTISSTNTDGNINLVPDGTGLVAFGTGATLSLRSQLNGINVFAEASDNPFIGMFQSDKLTRNGFFSTSISSPLTLTNEMPGLDITLVGRDAADTTSLVMLRAQPDGAAAAEPTVAVDRLRITAVDDLSLVSVLHGFQIGPSTGANLAMDNNEIMARNNGAIATLNINVNGGSVQLGNTSGTNMLINDLGSAVIEHLNDAVFSTLTAAAGGVEVNNTLTGVGLERVLTVSDIGGQGAVKIANQNVGSSIVLVDATDLSVPLQPSSSYVLEATLIFSGNGATANGFRWGLDFNGQIANLDTLLGGSFSWQNSNGAESIVDAAAGGISQIKTTFDAAGVRETVKISVGIITQSDYVADTNVDIQFAQGTSDATNTTLEEGSSLKVTRVA